MNKPTQLLIVGAVLMLLAGGAAWLLRDRMADAAGPDPSRAEYNALVTRLGGDEPAVRDELNDLVGAASVRFDAADQSRVNALTRECLDAKALLEIGHVQTFLAPAARGEGPPYHFVGDAHRARLQALAGDNPAAEQVLAVRKALARLGAEFALIRQPPDWNIKVDGEPLPLPFLELLREAHQFLPPGRHPVLRPEPKVAAFSGADGELLAQLDQFFNGVRAKAAFPPDKFPKLYVNGRIPPVPTALDQYRAQVVTQMETEMGLLTQEANPDPGKVEALSETYDQLGRFFEAISDFGK